MRRTGGAPRGRRRPQTPAAATSLSSSGGRCVHRRTSTCTDTRTISRWSTAVPRINPIMKYCRNEELQDKFVMSFGFYKRLPSILSNNQSSTTEFPMSSVSVRKWNHAVLPALRQMRLLSAGGGAAASGRTLRTTDGRRVRVKARRGPVSAQPYIECTFNLYTVQGT